MASSRDIDASPRLPVVTPADTPLSQPLKLRFKLSSDVVGESSVSPDVSKDTLAPSSTPMDWSAGGHSSHKKKRRHKKEKKKKKKKYHDRYIRTCFYFNVIFSLLKPFIEVRKYYYESVGLFVAETE